MTMFDYSGVVAPYKNIGQKIEDIEYQVPLLKEERTNVQPLELNSTIRFNSTYIEIVDKIYHEKGSISFFCLLIVIPLLMFMILLINITINEVILNGFEWVNFLSTIFALFAMGSVIYFVYYFGLKKDTFTYTHFPIRFNRKNKIVYQFKMDGSIGKYNWDDLYTAIMISEEKKNKPRDNTYDVRLNVLDENNVITQAFALPYCQESYLDEEKLMYKGLWEYVRRYMEEGVEDSYNQVEKLIPIAHQRETLWLSIKTAWFSFYRNNSKILTKNKNGIYEEDYDEQRKLYTIAPLIQGIFFNFLLIFIIGRYAIAKLAKRPIWPDWVEKECIIDANDPYDLEKRSKNKRPIKSLSFAGLLVYILTVILAYLNLYATAWFIDMIAMAKDAPINLHKLMEFWNWFG